MGEAVQSTMRPFFFFVCSSFILLPLVAGEPENPLQGSLRDPWQVVTGQKEAVQIPHKKNGSHQVHPSPQTQTPFGPSFSDFSAQYGSRLDLSTLGDTAGDSVAQRFARGEGDWTQFQPSQGVFQDGAIFYGDPRALSRDRGPVCHYNRYERVARFHSGCHFFEHFPAAWDLLSKSTSTTGLDRAVDSF